MAKAWISRFQFLNGAIKTPASHQGLGVSHIFQFLNGAIKTINCVAISSVPFLFQFLNGAIKTIPVSMYTS